MKIAVQKSPIPKSHAYVAQWLKQPFFDPNWHFHPEYQLFMVVKGRGTMFIGDTIKPYQQGDITFTGPNVPHLWRSDHDSFSNNKTSSYEGIVVYFNEDVVGRQLLQKEEGIKLGHLLKSSLRGVSVTGETAKEVRKMLYRLMQLDGYDGVLTLLEILHRISRSHELENLASPGYINSLKVGDTERMSLVYAYVMKHYQKKIAVTELAELTNMTPTSFSRYFRIHANKTFSEFISEIRIGHACKLLIEYRMNASQACYASGYQSLSNFNKQFKRITKRTPLDYKRAYGLH